MTAVTSTRGRARPGWLGSIGIGPPKDPNLARDAFWIGPSFVVVGMATLAMMSLAYGGLEHVAQTTGAVFVVGANLALAYLTNALSGANPLPPGGEAGRKATDRALGHFVLAVSVIGSLGAVLAKAVALRLGLLSGEKGKVDPAASDSLLGQLFARAYHAIWSGVGSGADGFYLAFLVVLLVAALAVVLVMAARAGPLGRSLLAGLRDGLDQARLSDQIAAHDEAVERQRIEAERQAGLDEHHRLEAETAKTEAGRWAEAREVLAHQEAKHLARAEALGLEAAQLCRQATDLRSQADEAGRRVEALTGEAGRLATSLVADGDEDADEPVSGRAARPRRRACNLVSAASILMERDGAALAALAADHAARALAAKASRDTALVAAGAAGRDLAHATEQVALLERACGDHQRACTQAAADAEAARAGAVGEAEQAEQLRQRLASLEARTAQLDDTDAANARNVLFLGALLLQPINVLALAPPAQDGLGRMSPLAAFGLLASLLLIWAALYWHYRTVARVAAQVARSAVAARAPLVAAIGGLVGVATTVLGIWGLLALSGGLKLGALGANGSWALLALGVSAALTPLIAALKPRWRPWGAGVLVLVAGAALVVLVLGLQPPGPPTKPVTETKTPPTYALRPAPLDCREPGPSSGASGAWRYGSASVVEAAASHCRLLEGDRDYVIVVGTASQPGGLVSQKRLARDRAVVLAKALGEQPKAPRVFVLNLGRWAAPVADTSPAATATQRPLIVLEGKGLPPQPAALKALAHEAGLDLDAYHDCDLYDLKVDRDLVRPASACPPAGADTPRAR